MSYQLSFNTHVILVKKGIRNGRNIFPSCNGKLEKQFFISARNAPGCPNGPPPTQKETPGPKTDTRNVRLDTPGS